MTVTWLIRHAVPVLLQPPLLTTDVKTSRAVFLGQSTHSETNVMNQPPICKNSDIVSSSGNILAPQVLNTIVTEINAIMISVYCQLVNEKSALETSMAASINVVTTKTLLAMLASQPNVDIQPAA